MKRLFFLLLVGIVFMSCDSDDKTYIVIETELGDMKFELYESTPLHKANMIKLINEGYYKDLLFHRIISGFMVQGGDPQSRDAGPGAPLGGGGPGYTIDAEIGAPLFKGTLASARTGDGGNPERKSSGSQFFIVQGGPQSEASLQAAEQRLRIQYNQAQKDKYIRVGGYPNIDMQYTVYGEIVEGMEVIDLIAALQKDGSDRPLTNFKFDIKLAN